MHDHTNKSPDETKAKIILPKYFSSTLIVMDELYE